MSAKRRVVFEWHGAGLKVKSEPFLSAFVNRRLRFEETESDMNLYFNEMFECYRLEYLNMKKAVVDVLCEEMPEEEVELRSRVEAMTQLKMMEESFSRIRQYMDGSERIVSMNVKFLTHPCREVKEEIFREENVATLVDLLQYYLEGKVRSTEIVEGCLRLFIKWMKLREESVKMMTTADAGIRLELSEESVQWGEKVETIEVIVNNCRKKGEEKSLERMKSVIGQVNGLIVELFQKEVDERLLAFCSLYLGQSLAILDEEDAKVPLAILRYYLSYAIKSTTVPSDYLVSFLNGLQSAMVYAPVDRVLEMTEALLRAWDRPVSGERLSTLPMPFDAERILAEKITREEGLVITSDAAREDGRESNQVLVGNDSLLMFGTAEWTSHFYDQVHSTPRLEIPPLYHRIHLFSIFGCICLKRLYLYGPSDQGLLAMSSCFQDAFLMGSPSSKLVALVACSGILSKLAFSATLASPSSFFPPDSGPDITFHLRYHLQYIALHCLTISSPHSLPHRASFPPASSTFWHAWRQVLSFLLSDQKAPALSLSGEVALQFLLSVLLDDLFDPTWLEQLNRNLISGAFSNSLAAQLGPLPYYDLSALSLNGVQIQTVSKLLSDTKNTFLIPLLIEKLSRHVAKITREWEEIQRCLHRSNKRAQEEREGFRPRSVIDDDKPIIDERARDTIARVVPVECGTNYNNGADNHSRANGHNDANGTAGQSDVADDEDFSSSSATNRHTARSTSDSVSPLTSDVHSVQQDPSIQPKLEPSFLSAKQLLRGLKRHPVWQTLRLFLDQYFVMNMSLIYATHRKMDLARTSDAILIMRKIEFCSKKKYVLHEKLLKKLIVQLAEKGGANFNVFEYLVCEHLRPILGEERHTNLEKLNGLELWRIVELEAFARLLQMAFEEFIHRVPKPIMDATLLPFCFASLTYASSKLNSAIHAIFATLFTLSPVVVDDEPHALPVYHHLVPHYLKLSLDYFPSVTSHLSLLTTLRALFLSSAPNSPIVPYVSHSLVEKIKTTQLQPNTSLLVGILFLLLTSVHIALLPPLLQHIQDLLVSSPKFLQIPYCKLLYKIISTNHDYQRKETLVHWYLNLAFTLGLPLSKL